jgi:hypothetical protein
MLSINFGGQLKSDLIVKNRAIAGIDRRSDYGLATPSRSHDRPRATRGFSARQRRERKSNLL